MVGDDHFCFPVVVNSAPQPMQSSLLWRISSSVCYQNEAEERAWKKEEDTDVFCSTDLEESAMERVVSSRREEVMKEVAVEEKIDMLWQDLFCEEEKLGIGSETMEERELEGKRSQKQPYICGGGWTATRGAGGGVVAFVKLLKKVHLIHDRKNSAHIQPPRLNVD